MTPTTTVPKTLATNFTKGVLRNQPTASGNRIVTVPLHLSNPHISSALLKDKVTRPPGLGSSLKDTLPKASLPNLALLRRSAIPPCS